MKILEEFKKFAMNGSVIDLAIGVVVGSQFSKIVDSLVNDIINPALLSPVLSATHLTEINQLVVPGTAIKYGNFVGNFISFIIVAFVLFLFVKMVNKFRDS